MTKKSDSHSLITQTKTAPINENQMNLESETKRIELPDGMLQKLKGFQKRVWIIKLCEGLLAASFGLLVSYLLVFAADRFFETPAWLRTVILLSGAIGAGLWFPLVCHQWIWKSRRLDQVARLLRQRMPRLGDHLLGIIELANQTDHRDCSEELCKAALRQVDEEIKDKDFTNAVPSPRHRHWAWIAGIPAAIVLIALLVIPAASTNAFARWLTPWRNVERFTFAQMEKMEDQIVVPTAERSKLQTQIAESSRWNPSKGSVWINNQKVDSQNVDNQYNFSIPPLKEESNVNVRIGDYRKTVSFVPMNRPELSTVVADVELPKYLERSKPLKKDVRGGRVTVVEGSKFKIAGSATRELVSAKVDGKSIAPHGKHIETSQRLAKDSTLMSLEWEDAYGLSAKSPLNINVRVVEDESPTLICKRLEKRRVIQVKEVLTFDVVAEDDFGVKKIGLEWNGSEAEASEEPVAGEKIISAGNSEAAELTGLATFSPKREGIEPQVLSIRVFAEDFKPGRERTYSPTYQVFVLSEEDHAVWLSKRLTAWQKETLESFEKETQLFNENQSIRNLPSSELDSPETRRRIKRQMAAERAQERRLNALVKQGEEITKEATNNDQFNIETLESLAESLAALKKISGERMPSVAGLLKKAAESQGSSSSQKGSPKQGAPQVVDDQSNGQNQGSNSSANKKQDGKKSSKGTPSITIKESSMDSPEDEGKKSQPSPSKKTKLTLPTVTLKDNSPSKQQPESKPSPAQQKMDEAVEEQEDLLAEFAKVAEGLQKIISDLEGSTFVKRLKSLSRKQLKIASDVNKAAISKFGVEEEQLSDAAKKRSNLISKRETDYTKLMEYIYSDLKAYANRVPDKKFKTVLSEMDTERPTEQLRDIAKQIVDNEPGASIAHAELLADTLDRWAEQMVGPG